MLFVLPLVSVLTVKAEVAIGENTGAYFTSMWGFPTSIDKTVQANYWCMENYYYPEIDGPVNTKYVGTFDRSYLIVNNSGTPKTTTIYFDSYMDDYWADLVMVYERDPNIDTWVMTGIVTMFVQSNFYNQSSYVDNGVYHCVYTSGDVIVRVKKIDSENYLYGYQKTGVSFNVVQN